MNRFLLSIMSAAAILPCHAQSAASSIQTADTAVVYHIREISPGSLIRIYDALGRPAKGKTGIKISSGESDKTNHLDTALINPLARKTAGRFIECNTAYAGSRLSSEEHFNTAEKHGFIGIDIMDSLETAELPVKNGFHLDKDIVVKRFLDYDFIIVLSHFKGHQMGGFGGALKNISIGIASKEGKAYIHSAGQTDRPASAGTFSAAQDDFLESMADACKAIADHCGDNILYINVANRLSVDCDCNANPAAPEMADFGILASLDPVALDQACVDMVFNSSDPGKHALVERINSRHGTHTIEAAEKLGIGTRNYKIITLE